MPTPFQTEAWTEYAIGMVILLARVSGRTWQLGFKWQGDDYFAALSILFFTAELVMLEMIGQHGAITGLTEEVAVALTPEQAARIRIGAKCLLAGWILYTTLIWCRKYYFLTMEHKLNQFHSQGLHAVLLQSAHVSISNEKTRTSHKLTFSVSTFANMLSSRSQEQSPLQHTLRP